MPEFDFRDNLITLARFNTPTEGAIARGRLQAEGIEAHLHDVAATWLNHIGPDLIGTELLVRQGDVRQAREVLADVFQAAADEGPAGDEEEDDDYYATDWSGEDWSDDDDDDDEQEWSEEDESLRTPPLSRAFRAAVIGLFLLGWLPGILNLYSIWLIWQHRLWETEGSWRYYVTIILNVVSLAVACWFWAAYVQ